MLFSNSGGLQNTVMSNVEVKADGGAIAVVNIKEEKAQDAPIPEGDPLVLVTGASGYIATHVVQQLLQQGYRVRGTVKSLKDEVKVQPICGLCPDSRVAVELVEANLTTEEGWLEVVNGCTFILHTASPFPAQNPENEEMLIRPAIDGTLHVLKAAKETGGVKRVILTSCIVAIYPDFDNGESHVYREDDSTDPTKKDIRAHVKSKTLAEKATWEFVNELSNDNKF